MNRNKKASLSLLVRQFPVASALLLLSVQGAGAQSIDVLVNGEPVRFATTGPQRVEGRVLVPVRGVLEKLGANVTWVPQTSTVVATTAQMDIQLRIGDRNAVVNGRTVRLDVPAQTIAGATMVPLRFLGEALGAEVQWNDATRTVRIATAAGGSSTGANPTTPANPGNAANNAAPAIASLTHSATEEWLSAGETLRVTLMGTAGGQASFRIPGVVENVPLRETEPGRYEGSWTVPAAKPNSNQELHIRNAAVLATLKQNGQTAPVLQAAQTVSLDSTAPTVRDLTPERNTKTRRRPAISAVFEDQGSGVDTNSVVLQLNDQNVTREANITRGFVSFTPESLEPGKHTVTLEFADRAGNKTRTQWAFTVPSQENQGIRTVKTNAADRLEPGDVLEVEVTGEPEGRATFTLGNIKNVPLRETEPGRYQGEYTIRKGDDVVGNKLTARLIAKDGERYTASTEENVVVTTGKPAPPEITSPTPSETVESPLVVRGTAAPNTRVQVQIDYQSRVLGVLGVKGTAAEVTVDVDKDGKWQTEPINLNRLFGTRNVEYTVRAVAINAADQESAPTTLAFKR